MRRFRLGNVFASTFAIAIALVVIAGLLSTRGTEIAVLTDAILQLTAVTIALAVLVGIWNLLTVHLGRMARVQNGWWYSLLTILAAVAVTAVYVLDELEVWSDDLEGERLSPVMFDAVQVSIEAALAGLIVFFLTYALYRLLSKRFTWASLIFIAAVVVALAGWLPLENDGLADAREWLLSVPVLAGSRGLLIGIGLGTVVAGIRALAGYERAYREP